MTSFERRHRLLRLIGEEPGLRIPVLAGRLGVSSGTIRNDLNALSRDGQLTRVRGGATIVPERSRALAFAARDRINEPAKQQIARRAAERVRDGDSVFFDASTTVYHLAAFVETRRNLTVVTNGIPVAAWLAQNPTNTVILIGGVLLPDATSVCGPFSEHLLQRLHVRTAFVSASGFTLEEGLTDVDLHEAHLKSRVIACADSVIALIDSSKFGRVDLTPFAQAAQVAHIYTNGAVSRDWIEKLERAGVGLTVCGDDEEPKRR